MSTIKKIKLEDDIYDINDSRLPSGDIKIPTKVSDLENDSGFITNDVDSITVGNNLITGVEGGGISINNDIYSTDRLSNEWYNIRLYGPTQGPDITDLMLPANYIINEEDTVVNTFNEDCLYPLNETRILIENYNESIKHNQDYQFFYLNYGKKFSWDKARDEYFKYWGWCVTGFGNGSFKGGIEFWPYASNWSVSSKITLFPNGSFAYLRIKTRQGSDLNHIKYVFSSSNRNHKKVGVALYKRTDTYPSKWHRISNIAYLDFHIRNQSLKSKPLKQENVHITYKII